MAFTVVNAAFTQADYQAGTIRQVGTVTNGTLLGCAQYGPSDPSTGEPTVFDFYLDAAGTQPTITPGGPYLPGVTVTLYAKVASVPAKAQWSNPYLVFASWDAS